MKSSKVCLFAYRPEHYRQMEGFLNKMMASGWKLKWCRGILAGFEPADRDLHYGVDPEAMTSLAYFRRLPTRTVTARLAEGWHAVARSKGCQIYASGSHDAPPLTPSQDIGPLVKSTCRLASFIWILVLALAGLWLYNQEAFLYSFVLTNLYLVAGLLGVCLLIYHVVNAILLTVPQRSPENPRVCKRYVIHSLMLLALLVLAIALEMGGRNDMLLYLAIPIAVIGVGIVVLQSLSGSEKNSNRMFLLVAVISVAMFGMIIFLNGRMSEANANWSSQQQEELLAKVDQLPVLQLSDFGDHNEPQQAVQVNASVLGENLLYAEESEAGYIFTNYTTMRSPALAKPIFDYLYQQAQIDFNETFEIDTSLGQEVHVLKEANSCLFQKGNSVCLFTVPDGTEVIAAAKLLLELETPVLP